MKSLCSDLLNEVIERLNHSGATVYFVGGCVRDYLMHQPCHDFDLEIFGIDETQLVTVLSEFGQVDQFGKQFGIFKLLKLPEADFALPRLETKIAQGHIGFDVSVNPYLDLKEAAKRRDFTMNAIYYNTKTNQFEDCYGGIEDIQNKVIRVVTPSTFIEDPLRVLRLAQFVSRFEFTIDKNTKHLCKQMVENKDLETLSKERVFVEYNKMLLAQKPSLGIQFLYEINALPRELMDLGQTMQRLDYHPEGCVLNHVKMVCDHGAKVKEQTSYPLGFMWSCFLHDIGKASTTDEKGSALFHEVVGAKMVPDVMKQMTSHKDLIKYTQTMVYNHMKIGKYARTGVKDKTYLKLLASIEGICPLKDLYYLCEADMHGRALDASEDMKRIQTFLNEKIEKLGKIAPIPLINGNDLIEIGIPRGAKFKEILAEAYDMQLGGYQKASIIKHIKKHWKID